jgi:TRAP-type mannitol/chloroaromatic compound transport system permease small subunit
VVKIPPRPGEAGPRHLAGLPPCAPADAIERAVLGIGKVFALAWLVLVLITVIAVAERYAPPITALMAAVFGPTPGTALTELQWHLYAAGFLVGLSYAMVTGAHVRIDVLAEHWSLRTKAWVELAGMALFLAPFAVFVLMHAIPFVERSWRLGEVSPSPGGLGARWIIKSFIIVGFALILAAALARTMRILNYLLRHRTG